MIRFQVYPAVKKVKFTCIVCEKPNREKTLRAECTLNPFNVDASGIPLSPNAVAQQSRDMVDRSASRFLAKPVCLSCENKMTYRERKIFLADRARIYANNEKAQ